MTEATKKSRRIMHVEFDPQLRAKLDRIVAELKADPRMGSMKGKITRQAALRHAIIEYALKGATE